MRKLLLLLFVTASLSASEGKWTPQQVLELDPKWLAAQGLQLPPERLWDAKRGTGLLAATISTGGCSAGWISAEGLFITNHHCLFSALQEHATPENDIITNGFLARTRDAELRSKTMRVTIPRRFTDVTKEIEAAVPASAGDAERYRLIERKMNDIVANCEKQPGFRCKVAAHDGGIEYVLQETSELADVRLVYAPPRAVGEFGGEVDNWMWPRHTGDFAIGRAYVDGKPYKPEFFFPIAKNGVKPGDFIMVLGYPGTTYRALTADEMEERHTWFGARAGVYRDWIRILEESTKGNAEGTIAVADNVKTLANRQKNGEGQLAGFRRGSILEKQRAGDETVLEWARKNGAHGGAVAAYAGLGKMAAEKKATFDRDFLLDHIRMTQASLSPTGPKALVLAVAIAKSALERQKPDAERDPVFMQRSIGRVREKVEREQKNYFAAADKPFLADFLRRARELPPAQRIAALDAVKDVDHLYASTKMFDLAERLKMFDETPEQLRARRDPLVDLGFALVTEIGEMAERTDRWNGVIARLRPAWRRAVIAHAGKPVAPDANSTLRVSFAHVKGYEPRDGVHYLPQTTLRGVVEKHTNEEPFDVPDRILAAARESDDVPVNFLGDADTTGGNSGSPTVNGRGELVGVNFDRVWENVANDFAYNPEIARNVNADIRYTLWLLERVEKATELLKELGVKE
ncbi:MAG TPA: S46 family peptidase [Thermoanaerobaculia bacterium]|nr:S46 family peptidase [Thermoanaerobaculia bacterium]